MVKGKLHTKIVALSYRKRNNKDITITEEIKHIMRDEKNLKKLHNGINLDKTKNNIIFYGDYEELKKRFENMNTISSYDRKMLNNSLSKYKKAFTESELALKEINTNENISLKKIKKIQKRYDDNFKKYNQKLEYRNSLINNNSIDYFEIIMSISNTQHILTMNIEKQKEYLSIFDEHLNNFINKNGNFGIRSFAIGHLDQSIPHVHNINEIFGGWGELKNMYITENERNPFKLMIEDISADFKNKYCEKLKKFGIDLDDNIEYDKQLNYTNIIRYKIRTKKKEELINDMKSFIKVPNSINEIKETEKDKFLALSLEAVKERDNYLFQKAESITYIDDKKHEIDILKQQLKQIFYYLDKKELDVLNESIQDKYIQTRIETSLKKDKERQKFLNLIQENFQKFIEFIKENFSNIMNITDKSQRNQELTKFITTLDIKKDEIKELTNNTLISDTKFIDKNLSILNNTDKNKKTKNLDHEITL